MVCVDLATGFGDRVAVTVVVGAGIGLGVAVVGSTLSFLELVPLWPEDVGKCKACSPARVYH